MRSHTSSSIIHNHNRRKAQITKDFDSITNKITNYIHLFNQKQTFLETKTYLTGERVGEIVGLTVGDTVGLTVGSPCKSLSLPSSSPLTGEVVGEIVGLIVGDKVGLTVGLIVGDIVGDSVVWPKPNMSTSPPRRVCFVLA